MEISEMDIRSMIFTSVAMLNATEAGKALGTTKEKISQYRRAGFLKGIKTGQSWMYSQEEIKAFQHKYAGYEIANDGDIERVKNNG